MKTPWYESNPGDLITLLGTRKFVWCDLYTFNLVGGQILRYSTGQLPVSIPGTTWSIGPRFNPTGTQATRSQKSGTDVANWQFTVMPRPIDPLTLTVNPDKIGSNNWPLAVLNGALDGATISVDRMYTPLWPVSPNPIVPTGIVTVFFGRVAQITIGGVYIFITVNSPMELLNKAYPIATFQAPCRHTLFDSGCTLIQASFAVNGTIATVVQDNIFTSTIAAPAGSGTYALGQVTMTSGNNNGLIRGVRDWNSSTFSLISPFPYTLQIGDAFTAYPGCDKTLATCILFNNLLNYGGQPYIPDMTTAF